jgi:hypothetical protein
MNTKAKDEKTPLVEAPKTAIEEYSRTAAALATLRHKYENVVWDVATKIGMEVAIKARAELRTYYVDLEKLRVKLKAPALERTRHARNAATATGSRLIATMQITTASKCSATNGKLPSQ